LKDQSSLREENIGQQQSVVTLLFYGTPRRIRTGGLRIRSRIVYKNNR
jgi:hypothetical protein